MSNVLHCLIVAFECESFESLCGFKCPLAEIHMWSRGGTDKSMGMASWGRFARSSSAAFGTAGS